MAHPERTPKELLSDRIAAVVFALAIAVAVPVILYKNRAQWFFLDEWDFLAGRDIRSWHDLVRPHNEHLSVIPIVLYRCMFRVVGLHHYWPYQLMVVVAHLGAAVLLRMIMRRARVQAWIATAAASLFAYFGSGREDVAWAFQIGFTGSLALGLAALVLADHDGPLDRRDAGALACGLGSLLCSGIGIPMVAGLAVALLVRRGWQPAVALVLPLAIAFLAWFAWQGQSSGGDATPGQMARLAANTVRSTFSALGGIGLVGILLGITLLAGGALIVASSPGRELRSQLGATAGLLAAAPVFLAITAYGRAELSTVPAGRYLHLLAAMVLPGIAVAGSALAARWRLALPAVLLLLLVGLPVNIRRLEPRGTERFTLGSAPVVLTVAAASSSTGLPRPYHPLPISAPEITIGWLQDERLLHQIPDPSPKQQALAGDDTELLVSLQQVGRSPGGACTASPPGTSWLLRRGDSLSITGTASATVERMVFDQPVASASFYAAPGPAGLSKEVGNIYVLLVAKQANVRVSPYGQRGAVSICRAS